MIFLFREDLKSDDPSEDEIKEQIFRAALTYVNKYGWTNKAIAAGLYYKYYSYP